MHDGKGDAKQMRAWEELEWRKCAADPEYFIDTYGWIEPKSGEAPSRWSLWPIQRLLLQEWRQGQSTIAVKARQLGVTTLSVHFALWNILFRESAKWYIVSKDEKSAEDALRRLRVTKDRLPRWMTERATSRGEMGTVRRGARSDAVHSVAYGNARLEILTSTPKQVQGKAGNFILDEFAAHTDQKRIWHLVQPSFDGGGMCIVIANGEGENTFYHLYQKSKMGDSRFASHFFSWADDPNRDEEWYTRTEREFLIENPDADRYAFKAQFPSTEREAFFIHGNSRYDLAAINLIAEHLKKERADGIAKWGRHPRTGFFIWEGDTVIYDRHPTGKVRLYFEPVPDARYIVAVDAAGGRQASDYCVAMVGRVHDDGVVEQVCVYEAKVEPEDELVYNALAMCIWYNGALLIPETGSSGHGQAFCNVAKRSYDYIFQAVRTSRYTDEEKMELGFATSSASRRPLLARLGTSLGRTKDEAWDREPTFIIHDDRTLDEIAKFEIDEKTGKEQAPSGGNDDLVIASALLLVGSEFLAAPRPDRPVRVFTPNEW